MKLKFVVLSLCLGTALIAQTPEESLTARDHQERGEEAFKRGDFKEAIAHWDRVIEILPAQKPYHWQRGIACYYAGEYEKGRRQFELHQEVNPKDVENAVWHFLCVARKEGLAAARKQFISIHGDQRVPMKEIHALFGGSATPNEVLAQVKADSPSPAELKSRLFYAHLYLGLFAEIQGRKESALKHIRKAAVDYSQPHYMGEVARVHLRRLEQP